jgi:FkbM family methyltransferase
MKLSYAQNMEDYVLAGVFEGEGPGAYVDIGGGHAVADNVTFHFYLRGWRGLVVEPQEKLAAAYAGIRPRDTVISALVGRAAGEAAFHEVEKLHGLSSMIAANAEAARAYGAAHITRRLPVTTLAALCDRHGLSRFDLLKIDVEGAEADVLAGNDWARFRPRVLCIEAVSPASTDAWKAWEPLLLGERYRFAYFDGLNRFYVAEEAAALLPRFPKERADWGAAAHLWDFGRALEGARHADHALAKALVAGFLARLPSLDPALLRELLAAGLGEGASTPVELTRLMLGDPARLDPAADAAPTLTGDRASDIAALMATDGFRAALGRIACFHDGGHIVED